MLAFIQNPTEINKDFFQQQQMCGVRFDSSEYRLAFLFWAQIQALAVRRLLHLCCLWRNCLREQHPLWTFTSAFPALCAAMLYELTSFLCNRCCAACHWSCCPSTRFKARLDCSCYWQWKKQISSSFLFFLWGKTIFDIWKHFSKLLDQSLCNLICWGGGEVEEKNLL